LILEGQQGVGKTTLLKTLFSPWYSDTLPELGSKEAMVQLRGTWCIEIAELASLTKSDANRIKAFLTTREDRFRQPYGRIAENVPRSNVFAGTVNVGATGYLKDPTGARRFWPVEIPGAVAISAIEAIKDQLWAETCHRFNAGHAYHLDDKDLIAAAALVQEDRYEGDVWEDDVRRYVEGREWVTSAEVLSDGLGVAKSQMKRADEMRVGNILKHDGWAHKKARKTDRNNGRPSWGYQRP
jgi:predicted P-loop ATPase